MDTKTHYADDATLERLLKLEEENKRLAAYAELMKRRLDWLLYDYRAVDLYNAIDVCGCDGSEEQRERCYAAIDAKLAAEGEL